jgi:hypothetical protein
MKKTVLGLSFLLLMTSAQAKLFKIINRTGDCNTLCDTLENEVNANLPDADQSNYLKGMANASVASQKGLGASYGNNLEYMEVGGTIALGADLGDNSMSDLIGGDVDANQIRGVGVGAAVTIGLKGDLFAKKIGFIDMSRASFYGYFLSLDAPDTDGLEGDTTSMGLHVQYKIIPGFGAGFGFFEWGGIDITTGIERSSMKLKFVEPITETVTEGGVTATFNGTATVGADVSTTTIPIEVSTNVRLLYITSLFGGLGMDISSGEAKSIANLSGNINITGGSGGTGTATLDLGSAEGPTTISTRAFFGLQLNLAIVNAFVLVNKGLTNDSLGLAVGARIGF